MTPIQQQSDQYLQNQNSLPISVDPAYYLSLPVTPVTYQETTIPPAFNQHAPANNKLSSHSISNYSIVPYLSQSHSEIDQGDSEDTLLSEVLEVIASAEWDQSAKNKEWTQPGENIEGLSQYFEQPSLTYLNTNEQSQDQLQKSDHYHLETSTNQNKIPATVTDLIDSDDSVEIPLDISKLSQDRAVSSHTFTGLNQFTNAQFTPATSTLCTGQKSGKLEKPRGMS
ncbi:hypothetical protein [Endozoicomonas sp. Mp262]|uniref:hypothetical protein n=1 Tax=Endozoicomonas sp. Mp262 TaxID=2919499 RepID=UPI0021D85011